MEWTKVRRSSAHHEAAHAVHAVAEGWEVRYVSVETEGRPDLRDACATRRPIYTEMVPVSAVVNLLAGERAAWWAHRGESMPERPFGRFVQEAEVELEDEEVESDEAQALLYLRRLADLGAGGDSNPWADLAQTYRTLCEMAERFILGHWAEIEAVARALLERGYLEGDEVLRAVDRAAKAER